MVFSLFRRLIGGSLSFAFLVLTWRSLLRLFLDLLTTRVLRPTQRRGSLKTGPATRLRGANPHLSCSTAAISGCHVDLLGQRLSWRTDGRGWTGMKEDR